MESESTKNSFHLQILTKPLGDVGNKEDPTSDHQAKYEHQLFFRVLEVGCLSD